MTDVNRIAGGCGTTLGGEDVAMKQPKKKRARRTAREEREEENRRVEVRMKDARESLFLCASILTHTT